MVLLSAFFSNRGNMLRHALADFQGHIADEAVADDHVHAAGENLAPLDVADEIERQVLQPVVRFRGQLVALRSLLRRSRAKPPWAAARRKSRGNRSRPSPRTATSAPTFESTFAPTSSSTVTPPRLVGKGAASAGRCTEGSVPSTKRATVITAPVLPALTSASAWPGAHQPRRHVRGTVFLRAKSLRGRVAHGDHFARRDHFDRQALDACAAPVRASPPRAGPPAERAPPIRGPPVPSPRPRAAAHGRLP